MSKDKEPLPGAIPVDFVLREVTSEKPTELACRTVCNLCINCIEREKDPESWVCRIPVKVYRTPDTVTGKDIICYFDEEGTRQPVDINPDDCNTSQIQLPCRQKNNGECENYSAASIITDPCSISSFLNRKS